MRSVGAVGAALASDPTVSGEAVEGGTGGLAADAGQQGQAARVGLHGGAYGLQGQDAERVEHAAIGGAAAAGPAAGAGVGALLQSVDVGGDRRGAAVEGGVGADLAGRGRDKLHRPVPLPAEDGRGLHGPPADALVANDGRADVFEAGRGLDELGDVGIAPAGGRGADEDPAEDRGGVAGGGVLLQSGRGRGRQLAARSRQVEAGVVVDGDRPVRVDARRELVDVDELRDALGERADLRGGAGRLRQRRRVAAQDGRASAGTVRSTRRPHAPGGWVRQRREVQGRAHVAHEPRERGHERRVDALGQADPHVAATGGAGGADERGQAGVLEEGGERVRVARGRGRAVDGLGVEVEAEDPEQVIGAGEVHRPRRSRHGPRRAAVVRVEVHSGAGGVDGRHADRRPGRDGGGERPGVDVGRQSCHPHGGRNAGEMYLVARRSRGYDGATSSREGVTKPRPVNRYFSCDPPLTCSVAKQSRSWAQCFRPPPRRGPHSLRGVDRQLLGVGLRQPGRDAFICELGVEHAKHEQLEQLRIGQGSSRRHSGEPLLGGLLDFPPDGARVFHASPCATSISHDAIMA